VTMNRMFLRGIVVSFFCLTGPLAFGASNRTWVSGGGSDSGTCPRSTPCATFAYALTQTTAGGEIDVLDPGDFGSVTIGQSVSIVADGVLGGILVTSNDGIHVTAGSSVVVVLRGLTINSVGSGGVGISFDSPNGGVLHIEDCTINGFGSDGISVNPGGSTKAFIKDTIVRNNGEGIIFGPTIVKVTASLDNVRVENNGFGGNGHGVEAGGNATVSVRNSVAAGNGTAGFYASSSPSMPAVMNLESSMASGSSTGVNSDGANSTINMSNVTVVDNTTGLSETSGGHIVSFGNNKITNNTTNGSPTKTISQQ
jgi:hypothetical protein